MCAYLFVHFKEKETVDGEQVYFAVSRDGFQWEAVNGGEPVLWSTGGDGGVRDHTIVRLKDNTFRILSTDLCLAGCFQTKYRDSWEMISREGSKQLSMWESDDLTHWSAQKYLHLGSGFGCLWAPDVVYDRQSGDYVLHWSSSHVSSNYAQKAIYYSRTQDFANFAEPQLLCHKEDSGIIDSAIYEEDGSYYRFLKSDKNPAAVILERGESVTGEYERVKDFDEEMAKLDRPEMYEAPTAFRLSDGLWCLMLDYFGVRGEGQGYVPFVADSLAGGRFMRANGEFSFPYRFKHGTVLHITTEEYDRIKTHYKA